MEEAKINSLVSVIMPLYNAEKYVGEAIESVINQTYTNWELIIVNDGSTDNSLEVALKYQSESVKVFTQENKGASAARNYGLKEAKGEYIQFLDADDVISSNKLEEQLMVLNGSLEKLAVCSTVHFFDGEDYFEKPITHDWIKEGSNDSVDFLIKLYGGELIGEGYGGMIQPNAWLTPRIIINKAGYWNEELTIDDDGEFFCRVVLASKGICYCYEAINYYRKFYTTKNLSAQKSRKAIESIYNSTILKQKYLQESTKNDLVNKVMARIFMEIAFSCYPLYRDISRQAEKEAKKSSKYKHKYIHKDFVGFASKFIGWKFAKIIQICFQRLSRLLFS